MIYNVTSPVTAYKGDYAPLSVYLGETRLAGWKTVQESGQSFTVQGTYKAPPDCLTVKGTVYGNGSQDYEHPATLTFAENPTVTIGGQSVTLPYTLRATADENGVINVFDTITVASGHVLYTKYVTDPFICTAKPGTSGGAANMNGASNQTAFFGSYTISAGLSHISALSTHYAGVKKESTNNIGAYWRVPVCARTALANVVIFGVLRTYLADNYGAYSIDALYQWIQDQNAAGTPLTLWFARSSPVVTDITETAAGQALLALRTTAGQTSFAVDKGSLEVTVKAVDV